MWVDCQVPGTSSGICWCECKTAWQKLTLGNFNLCKTLKLSRFSTPFSSHLFTYYWVDDHPFTSKTVGVQDIALWWRNIKKEYTRVLVHLYNNSTGMRHVPLRFPLRHHLPNYMFQQQIAVHSQFTICSIHVKPRKHFLSRTKSWLLQFCSTLQR